MRKLSNNYLFVRINDERLLRLLESIGKKLINLKYCWVRLFKTFCSVHRAIHLQLLTFLYLSVEELLLAPRQFVSRRRRPATIIYNTRDTNFIGADSVFRKVEWNKVKE